MPKQTKKQPKTAPIPRKQYSQEDKTKARKYYLMGLNMTEIGILLNGVPVRTLEKWQAIDHWTELKQPATITQRTMELHKSGKSYAEIAEILKINRVTVWRYIKQAKSTETLLKGL